MPGPSLVRSIFVFDEIHAYSPKLFGHLLRFLEAFSSTPVLLMTATLPPGRREVLEKTCAKRGGIAFVHGPPEREQAPRYSLARAEPDDAWAAAADTLEAGGKVLWICNTVARAMAVYQEARNMGLPAQAFHSRFRYRDRLKRQRAVVDGFAPNKPPMLAVTTQVAEMSLDLSADLLVTEYAPVPSLIQRLGRLNRFEELPHRTRPGLFLLPDNMMPYAKREEEEALLKSIAAWLDQVADGREKSQDDISHAFAQVSEADAGEPISEPFCDWMDDPAISLKNRHALMEPGHTMEVIREEDLGRGPNDEMAIPMPFPKDDAWMRWPRRGRFVVAPENTIAYNEDEGGRYVFAKPEDWIV